MFLRILAYGIFMGACMTAQAVEITPAFRRLDLASGSTTIIDFTVTSPVATTLLAAEANCRCLAVTTPMPLTIPAGGTVTLRARVAAVQAGVERVMLRTTTGSAHAEVQVVTGTLGAGKDILAQAMAQATARHERIAIIVHDLKGHVRNCGCTNGSLGGIDHLAALPAWWQKQFPQVSATFHLTGDTEGATSSPPSAPPSSGIGVALQRAGWILADPTIRIADDPAPLLIQSGIIAIITTSTSTLNHRRIVRPVADGGMTAMILRINDQGFISEQIVLPIDASLPADPAILASFPERLTSTVIGTATRLADSCTPCHQTAATSWIHSRHVHAWDSLKPADQVDGCVSCHSTPVPSASSPNAIAMGVACQACHQGTDAHLASGGTVRTTGATDCRSCHAPRHDPGFQRDKAWQVILHGKEVAR